jgi:hypothetical protein
MKPIALCAISVAAVLAIAPAVGAAPGDGIANTAHDFTQHNSTGPEVEKNAIDVGLCTFCHTPHKAQETKLLWNHTLSGNTFDWSDVTTTQGGTPLNSFDSGWSGVSKNCLSCHDGSVAIGDVAWFNAQSWTGAGNEILDHKHDTPGDPGQIATVTGDLAGNHPVAHPFPFNGAANTYNGGTSGAFAVLSGWQADPESLGIRLFNDSGGEVSAGSVPGSTGIECSSCHDPHNGSGVLDDFFLRGTVDGNTTDYICLKCHDK